MANHKPIYKGVPEKFWVVTKCPGTHSILEDVLFESDIPGMIRQYLGGLKWEEVIGIYADRNTAEAEAKKVLKFFNKDFTKEEKE